MSTFTRTSTFPICETFPVTEDMWRAQRRLAWQSFDRPWSECRPQISPRKRVFIDNSDGDFAQNCSFTCHSETQETTSMGGGGCVREIRRTEQCTRILHPVGTNPHPPNLSVLCHNAQCLLPPLFTICQLDGIVARGLSSERRRVSRSPLQAPSPSIEPRTRVASAFLGTGRCHSNPNGNIPRLFTVSSRQEVAVLSHLIAMEVLDGVYFWSESYRKLSLFAIVASAPDPNPCTNISGSQVPIEHHCSNG